MVLESFCKQNWEEFFISGSILNVQEADETIDLVQSTVVAKDKDGNDVSTTILDDSTKALTSDPKGSYSNNALKIKVKSGEESKSPYIITFRLTTNKTNKWEVNVRMWVQ